MPAHNNLSLADEAFDELDEEALDDLWEFDDEDDDDESLGGVVAREDVSVELRLTVAGRSRDREGQPRRPRRRRLVPVHREEPDENSAPGDERIKRFRTLCGLSRLSPSEVGELLQLCRDVGRHLADEDVVA